MLNFNILPHIFKYLPLSNQYLLFVYKCVNYMNKNKFLDIEYKDKHYTIIFQDNSKLHFKTNYILSIIQPYLISNYYNTKMALLNRLNFNENFRFLIFEKINSKYFNLIEESKIDVLFNILNFKIKDNDLNFTLYLIFNEDIKYNVFISNLIKDFTRILMINIKNKIKEINIILDLKLLKLLLKTDFNQSLIPILIENFNLLTHKLIFINKESINYDVYSDYLVKIIKNYYIN